MGKEELKDLSLEELEEMYKELDARMQELNKLLASYSPEVRQEGIKVAMKDIYEREKDNEISEEEANDLREAMADIHADAMER